jgi:hypothetical protein
MINLSLMALVLCGMGMFYALCVHSMTWLIYFIVMAGINVWVVNRSVK